MIMVVQTPKLKVNNKRGDYMKRVFRYNGKDSVMQLAKTLKQVSGDNPVFFCVGSEKSVIDSLGPKIGTHLKKRSDGKLVVYGIQGDAITALNVQKAYRAVKHIHPTSKIIVIDAALGDSTGTIRVENDGIRPGSGTGKDLGIIGDEGIICTFRRSHFTYREDNILFMGDEDNIFVTQSMRNKYNRLNKYVNTAVDTIANAILLAAA